MADLPKEPVTRQEMYLSKLAGENTTLPVEPVTREEMYLEGAIGRVEAVEQEVEDIKNNPDVADIVATYAALQAYDKSTLTDKDVIRVLADETHSGDSTYYRYSKSSDAFTYIGESKQYTNFVGTDGVTAGTAGLVPAPAITDVNKFLKANGVWDVVSSGPKELTLADYNYNMASGSTTEPYDCVALWLLPAGVYEVPDNNNVKAYYANTNAYRANKGTYICGGKGTKDRRAHV